MRRRTFLQALSTVFLPLVVRPGSQQQTEPPDYTDSDSNTPATLTSLHDANTTSGGVTYQP